MIKLMMECKSIMGWRLRENYLPVFSESSGNGIDTQGRPLIVQKKKAPKICITFKQNKPVIHE